MTNIEQDILDQNRDLEAKTRRISKNQKPAPGKWPEYPG